jgi:hypothetical protein
LRADLEAAAHLTRDVVVAMERDSGIALHAFRVDGCMTVNELLMQFQSDLLDAPVDAANRTWRPTVGRCSRRRGTRRLRAPGCRRDEPIDAGFISLGPPLVGRTQHAEPPAMNAVNRAKNRLPVSIALLAISGDTLASGPIS